MRIGDIDIAFTDVGSGPTVVFVHGLAEDRTSWSPQLDGLEGFRRIAIDLRGHGETSLGDAQGTLDQLRDDLVGFLESVTGPAALVGFSLGGVIVLRTALDRPDLVTRAVVVATSSVVGRAARAFFEGRIALAESGDREALRDALRADTAAQVVTGGVDLDQLTKWRMDAIGDGGGYVNAARAMIGVADRSLTPELAEISVEVDVVGATEDQFCPRKAADILLEGLPPGARYHEVEGAGHLMNVDRPQAVTALLRTALTRSQPS